jgi:hypothetical protein
MAPFLITIIALSIALAVVIYVARRNHLRTTVNETIKQPIVLKISVPINNDKKALATEQLFQAYHGILRGTSKSQDLFSFEIVANHSGIYFIVVCEPRYKSFVENQIYAQYPSAQIMQVHDYVKTSQKHSVNQLVTGIELALRREFYLPIKTFQSFEVDPLSSITSAMSKLNQGDEVWIQIVARPIADSWQEQGKSFINARKQLTDAEGKKVALESGESQEMREIERKNSKSGFQFAIRVLSKSLDSLTAQQRLEDVQAAFSQFQTPQYNAFIIGVEKSSLFQPVKDLLLGQRMKDRIGLFEKYSLRFLDEYKGGILNIEELASVYHLPNSSVQTPNISWAKSRKIEPPLDLPTQNIRLMGVTDYRDVRVKFGIKKEDRRRHMYLLGKTGTGKSVFIKNLVYGDIQDGEGFGVVDPHGDLVEEILEMIPEHRLKDVVYLDPSDTEHPIGINMLDLKEGESRELIADGIVSVFIKLFGHSWGPRLQYILTNTILTLLHCQNVSLLAVQRILTDKNYRRFLLKQVDDPFLLKFWNEEYEQMAKNPKLITEAIAPIQNKVGRFLSSPMVRNMIGQIKSTIDLREIMDSGKILLVNLSQGKIGEENTALLGGMLITRLYTNAMQRANLPGQQRRDFYLYVDEFQNFANDTFVKILSEARKYGLNLMVTHQFIDQLPVNIQDAIFGNVGTIMNYVVGPKDAERLSKEYKPELTAEDLVNLERFSMALKLTINGAQSKTFTARVPLPNYNSLGFKEQIKAFNRQTYALDRPTVEQKLNKWATQQYNDKGNLLQK